MADVTIDLMEYATDALAQLNYKTDSLKLWSKLESDSDVTSPQIGTAGTVTGDPGYVACKFNNGVGHYRNTKYVEFPTSGNDINLDKGTVEFWAKLNFAYNDAENHGLFDFDDGANGGIRLNYGAGTDKFRLRVRSATSTVIDIESAVQSFSSGDLMHFAVTWDRTGTDIGSSKTIELFINDTSSVSSTTTWNSDTVNANMVIGYYRAMGAAAVDENDVVTDNLKTYNIVKTDFSDKDDEDYTYLQSYSESTIKTQGSYSLKGIAAATLSLNDTLTRTVDPTIDLSDQDVIKMSIRASRTGSNIKIGFHDSGGTTTEHTANILSANEFQTETIDISAVANADKDAIDSIIITITNADA